MKTREVVSQPTDPVQRGDVHYKHVVGINELRQLGLSYQLKSCRELHEGRRVQVIRLYSTFEELLVRTEEIDELLGRMKAERRRVSIAYQIADDTTADLF